MCVAFDGSLEFGQFLGDSLCSIKTAWLFAQSTPCSKYLLTLHPKGQLNFLWQKWIDRHNAEVIYDDFDIGNADQRFAAWDKWRRERSVYGKPFTEFRELYRRIDGGHRQGVLCGGEVGLGKRNIFEYLYCGQEGCPPPHPDAAHFNPGLIYHGHVPPERDVYIAPLAKCQGNAVFTLDYWNDVVRRLVSDGISVTVNMDTPFCDDLRTNPLFRKVFPPFKELLKEVQKHRLVACGNTGVGWLAAAAGVPVLAMQHPDSHMQDYRWELPGTGRWVEMQALVEYLEKPNVDYCVQRIREEVRSSVVLTTGCYDGLHVGHVRHLEESRALGTKLVVCLNSDASVKRLKGEGRPIHNQEDRMAVLRALRCVDEVRIFDGDTALPLIHEIRPQIVTNGCDHKLEEIVGKDFVEKCGGRVALTGGERTVSTTQTIQKVVRMAKAADVSKAVRDVHGLTPNPEGKLRLMADQFLSVVNLEGDVADLGSYKGACAIIFKQLATHKKVHLFDTWAGNPHVDPLCHHGKGEWAASLEECKKVVGEDGRTFFHQGVFPRTAEKLNGEKFCFAYIDPDTYQSVKAAIEWFWDRMTPGGKILFDDYGWIPCSGVQKAVDEMFRPEQRQIFSESYACIVVK